MKCPNCLIDVEWLSTKGSLLWKCTKCNNYFATQYLTGFDDGFKKTAKKIFAEFEDCMDTLRFVEHKDTRVLMCAWKDDFLRFVKEFKELKQKFVGEKS